MDTSDILVVPSVDNHQSDSLENQDISANVTVETTQHSISHTEVARTQPTIGQSVSHDLLLGRWRLALDLFGRVFMEDVGLEPGSIVSELGGFPVKEAKFRRDMEKLRNNQQRDLTLAKMERDRTQLILQTFKEFNTQYNTHNRRASSMQPPMAVNRVKVTFKDEPGEGSGVARSFYTALAEALLVNEKLPNLESVQVGNSKYTHYSVLQRIRRDRDFSRRTVMNSRPSARSREYRRALSYDARPYCPVTPSGDSQQLPASNLTNNSNPTAPQSPLSGPPSSNQSGNPNEHLSTHQQQLGERLYPKVYIK